MKDKQTYSAQEWTELAKIYGDECIEIQRKQALTPAQKLDAQSKLTQKLLDKIENDPNLSETDKKNMSVSVTGYMNEWKNLSTFHETSDCAHKDPQVAKKGCCCKH